MSYLARLKPEDIILIHGASEGVGLAAIQYAQLVGAGIIATAGTQEKRSLLRLMGIIHVLDSRSLLFADQVMEATEGRGVDVVLNSLSGEAIQRNLGVLRQGGRFIELGKRDFYANSRIGLRPFRNNVSFFGVDMDALTKHERSLGCTQFSEMARCIMDGSYRPLLYRTYPGSRVDEAFRLMQNSRHVGKVVVTLDDPIPSQKRTPRLQLAADGTYLVVGGLDGFGAATARWLAARGARHLALVGRRGPATPGASALIKAMASLGADAKAYSVDVSKFEDVQAVVNRIDDSGFPLRGVIHSAMVLDDARLSDLTPERFRAALAPKMLGGINLDRVINATRALTRLSRSLIWSRSRWVSSLPCTIGLSRLRSARPRGARTRASRSSLLRSLCEMVRVLRGLATTTSIFRESQEID